MATATSSGLNGPYTVALTGGIASGKTLVSNHFAELGAAVIDTDVLAREVVRPGSAGLTEIAASFGTAAIAADGGLDRRALRGIVFQDSIARARLEAITHPRIRALAAAQLGAISAPYAVLVVPLLAENYVDYRWVDRILVVDVDRATQRARLLKRDEVTQELAEAMIEAQAGRSERLAIANDVIVNSGTVDELKRGVEDLDRQYRSSAQD